jgi:hypothetical protein
VYLPANSLCRTLQCTLKSETLNIAFDSINIYYLGWVIGYIQSHSLLFICDGYPP